MQKQEQKHTYANTETQDEIKGNSFIDLFDIWSIIKQQKWVIIFILFIVVSVTAAYTFIITEPSYQSSAVILIKEKAGKIDGFTGLSGKSGETEESVFVRTQYEMIRNRILASQVVDELGLRDLLIKKSFEQKKSVEDIFLSDLSMVPIERTNLVKINYEAKDPDLAAKTVNTIIATAMKLQINALSSSNNNSIQYLEGELAKARQSLTDAENKMVDYANGEGILSIDKEQAAPLGRLTELYKALGVAATTRIQTESIYLEAKKNKNVPEILASQLISSLKTSLAAKQASYQEKLKLFKPDYPEMQMLAGQIKEMKQKVNTEVNRAKRSLQARYLSASNTEKKIAQDVNKLEKELMRLQDKSVEYNTLKREVASKRKLYEEFLTKFQQIKISAKIDANYIKVIEPAIPPQKQYRPKPTLNLIVGSIIGLLLGIGIGFLRNSASKKITSTRMLKNSMGLRILGTIPEIAGLANRKSSNSVSKSPNSAAAQAYRILSTSLNNISQIEKPKVLMVTSANPSEGKSTVAINLAYAQAMSGTRVLVVDADLRRPSIHTKAGIKNSYGLSDYLTGHVDFKKIIQVQQEQKGLYIMTAGHLSRDPAKLLSSKKFSTFLQHASQYFDQIIIDTPPVIGFADTLIIAPSIDGIVFVVDENKMEKDKIQDSLNQVMRINQNILGFVVTKAKMDVLKDDYYQDYYARNHTKKSGLFGWFGSIGSPARS